MSENIDKLKKLINKNTELKKLVNFLSENMLEVETCLGENFLEKVKLKTNIKALETDMVEYIKLYATIQKEANQIEREKNTLIENEFEILKQLGEINEEKRKVEKERELIEQSSMDIAKSLGEVFMEKKTVEELNKELKNKTEEANAARQQIHNLINKIFPEEISTDMIQGKENFKTLNVTIAFSDIKNFSTYAKGKKPDDIAGDLKNYFNDLDNILKSHNGWLVKYIGDSAMMLFGVPYLSRSHAMDSILTALRIKEITKNHPWDTRFGINTGLVTVGDIGSINRPQYDAVGDAVNVAARLERLGKKEKKDILVTVDTYVKIYKFFHTNYLGDIDLKGVGEHRIYEVCYLKGIFNNEMRVPPESILYKKYNGIEGEVKKRIKELFPNFDFLKLESKDGSLNHSLAVSVYSIALKRELNLNINEDDLIIISCAHDMGKLYIKSTVLKKDDLSEDENEVINKLDEFSIKVMKKLNMKADKIPLVKEVFSKNPDISLVAKIVKIANLFDSLIFPKFYVLETKTIEEAIDILLKELPYPETETFVRLILPQ